MLLLSRTFFSKLSFEKKVFQEYYQCQTVWIQTWVQTVCKGYQQTTKFAASKERIFFMLLGHLQIKNKFI